MDKQCVPEPKHKKEVHQRWKQEQTTAWEECKNTVWTHTDSVRKYKTWMNFQLVRKVKVCRNGFCKYAGSKSKLKENKGPQLSERRWKRVRYSVLLFYSFLLVSSALRLLSFQSLQAESVGVKQQKIMLLMNE